MADPRNLARYPRSSNSNNAQVAIKPIRYARATRTGRSRPNDTWDVELEKNEVVEVLKDLGRDWYYVRTRKKQRKGTVHGSRLDFKYHESMTPPEAFAKFQELSSILLGKKDNTTFITLSFVFFCEEAACKEERELDDTPDFCIHELEKVLRGSGKYSCDLLKEERFKWHPDRFARHCREDRREILTKKATILCAMLNHLIAKEKESKGL